MEETRAQIADRHQQEWNEFRKVILTCAIQEQDMEQAKLAKTLADVLKICQTEERKALDFAEGAFDGSVEIAWEE